MKKILKFSLIFSLIFIFLTIVSFFIFDFGRVNLNHKDLQTQLSLDNVPNIINNKGIFQIEDDYKLIESVSTDEFSDLDVDFDDLFVVISPSDSYGYEIYSKEELKIKDKDINKDVIDMNYDKEKKLLKLNQKTNLDGKSDYKIVILSPNLENLSANIVGDNGVYDSKASIKNLNLNIKNSVINISGENSYPITVKSDNSVLNMKFENYDAEIKAYYGVGFGKVFNSAVIRVDDDNYYYQTFKNGRDKINMKSDNMVFNIN